MALQPVLAIASIVIDSGGFGKFGKLFQILTMRRKKYFRKS